MVTIVVLGLCHRNNDLFGNSVLNVLQGKEKRVGL